ncbi:MAG: SDR family oxidoreductase [Desulfobacterium sp.]|nr:SDR family oxidoreductase [Desulfobacterium sp.]
MKDRNKDLQGKVAIVTGSGSADGIGIVIVQELAKAGAKVVLTGRREKELVELTEGLKKRGLDVACHLADMAEEKSIEGIIKFTVNTFGRIDILVNNAASTAHPGDKDAMNMDTEAWDSIFAINTRGTMLACKHAIPEMLKVGGGSIINMSSGTSLAGDMQYTAYASSKGAVNTLTRYIATQYGRQGIRCNALIIGLVRTGGKAQDHLPAPVLKILEDNHATGKLGRSEDVAKFIRFLSSDDAVWITGQHLNIDGGFFAHLPTTGPIADFMASIAPKK